MTRTTPEPATPQDFCVTTAEGRLAKDVGFSVDESHTADLQWKRISNLEPPAPKLGSYLRGLTTREMKIQDTFQRRHNFFPLKTSRSFSLPLYCILIQYSVFCI
ncbi:hypothetical protein AVEN_227238-1 [Araneus ventricosus]|uniref:Uncharacterized protein n=1 Tax=Araneus ventricosus TaxID=182803 RepID=A0A4Y2IMB9_ARAVE|nr:hypothetical protein AVEN_227238-1 [Araneus ventricosus]